MGASWVWLSGLSEFHPFSPKMVLSGFVFRYRFYRYFSDVKLDFPAGSHPEPFVYKVRYMSCLFWLNDEVEGGETVLWLHCTWLSCARPSHRISPHYQAYIAQNSTTSTSKTQYVKIYIYICDINIIHPAAWRLASQLGMRIVSHRIAKPHPWPLWQEVVAFVSAPSWIAWYLRKKHNSFPETLRQKSSRMLVRLGHSFCDQSLCCEFLLYAHCAPWPSILSNQVFTYPQGGIWVAIPPKSLGS